MNRLLWLSVLFFPMVACNQARDRDRLIGDWRLVSLEEPDADGKVQRVDATGLVNISRGYELSGKRLIVSPSNPDEHWRVTWEQAR